MIETDVQVPEISENTQPETKITRRDFLRGAAFGVSGLVISGCAADVKAVNKVIETIVPTPPEAITEAIYPIQEIPFAQLQQQYPDELKEARASLKSLVPAWEKISDNDMEMDYYLFNSEESGKKKTDGWAMVASIDNMSYLLVPTSQKGAMVHPLQYVVDDGGRVTYFTVQNEQQVPFMESTPQGTTAYLADGKTFISDIVLPNPNLRTGKMASGIKSSDFLEGSISFDIESGSLTAQNLDGQKVEWDGSEWVISLPKRWDEAEVMERVQAKFEQNKDFFDTVATRNDLIVKNREITLNVRNNLTSYYYSDGSEFAQSVSGNENIQNIMFGKAGFLFDYEVINGGNELDFMVGYVALMQPVGDGGEFSYLPVVLGVRSRETGVSTSLGFYDKNSKEGVADVYSFDQLTAYLDSEMSDSLPLVQVMLDSVVDQTDGSKNGIAMSRMMTGTFDGMDIYPSSDEQRSLMSQFITEYYSDEDYPVFPDIKEESDAGKYSTPGSLVREAKKTRFGIIPTAIINDGTIVSQ
jgi:hypothetical protein